MNNLFEIKSSPDNASHKKEESPKFIDSTLLAVGGLLLLGIVIAVAVWLFTRNKADDTSNFTPQDPTRNPIFRNPSIVPPLRQAEVTAAPGNSAANTAPVQAAPIPYNVIAPPNPKYATGTIGILATKANISEAEAGSLAKFANNQFKRNGKWTNMQIAVFTDSAAAKSFGFYQSKRRGAPLSQVDYQQLASTNVWTGAAAYYESQGQQENVLYPSKNPMRWWGS